MKFQSHILLISLYFYVCIYGVMGEEEMLHVSLEAKRTILWASVTEDWEPPVMGAGNRRTAGGLTAKLYFNPIYLFFY